jgi:putative colanic acid biosynthesis acetyltransferase WcaF
MTHRRFLPFSNQLARYLWGFVYSVFFRPSPIPFHVWRRFLLRLFGAHIARGAHPYPRCRIWAPWNLTMEEQSCLADHVDCYSVAPVVLGARATVSQYSYICTATHDYEDPNFALIARPIVIGPDAWVAAGAFLGPGVTVGEGSVVGARAVVVKDVAPWLVVAGTPARPIKRRMRKTTEVIDSKDNEHQCLDPHSERREEPVALP